MKIYGTIEEWLKYKPEASLVNKKFMIVEEYYIHSIKKLDKEEEFSDVYFTRTFGKLAQQFGAATPIKEIIQSKSCVMGVRMKAKAKYTGMIFSICGTGSSCVITEETANDPNWTECEWDK